MICKHILFITFFPAVKWFQVFLSNMNNSININQLILCFFLFYGISTIVGYLMPNPFLYI